MCKFELGVHKYAHIECLATLLETSKTADMKKSDIRITQIDGEVKLVGKTDSNQTFKIIFVH